MTSLLLSAPKCLVLTAALLLMSPGSCVGEEPSPEPEAETPSEKTPNRAAVQECMEAIMNYADTMGIGESMCMNITYLAPTDLESCPMTNTEYQVALAVLCPPQQDMSQTQSPGDGKGSDTNKKKSDSEKAGTGNGGLEARPERSTIVNLLGVVFWMACSMRGWWW